MTGSVGDSGMRERWFFLDCLVVGEDAGKDEEWDEEVKQVVGVHSSENVVNLSVFGRVVGVVDDRDIVRM